MSRDNELINANSSNMPMNIRLDYISDTALREKIESGEPLAADTVMNLLEYRQGAKGLIVILSSRPNIKIIVDRDINLCGLFKYNELTQSIWITRQPLWRAPSSHYEMRDVDLYNLQLYIETVYGISDTGNKIQSVLETVAHENAYNPVTEYFKNELPVWDGKPHAENLLPDYLGAVKNELNTSIMKLWMLEAINRAFRPGCKADYMLILIGEQGLGKTFFSSRLAIMPEWFTDNFNTIQGDAAFEKLRGNWILEFGELLAIKSAQTTEAIKAFITSTDDRYRKKYGKITESHPRRCVFIGTTNSRQFLVDKSGNRRFMPIQVGIVKPKKNMFTNTDELDHEIHQAWAEMYHIYNTEHPALILPEELNEQLEHVRDGFLEDDYKQGMIMEYLERLPSDHNRVCAMELWERALHQADRQPTRKDIRDISEIMRSGIDGWDYVGRQRTSDYGIQNCIERSVRLSDKANTFTEIENADEFPF